MLTEYSRIPPLWGAECGLLATMSAKVDYLFTHNRVHFIDDPSAASKANLKLEHRGMRCIGCGD